MQFVRQCPKVRLRHRCWAWHGLEVDSHFHSELHWLYTDVNVDLDAIKKLSTENLPQTQGVRCNAMSHGIAISVCGDSVEKR